MKVSEMIRFLEQIRADHGDLTVAVLNAEYMQHGTGVKIAIALREDDATGPFDRDPDLPDRFVSISEF